MPVLDHSPIKVTALPKMRRAVTDFISAGKNAEPIFIYFDMDITRLIHKRKQLQNPPSITAYLIWFWGQAYQKYPMFNSFIVGNKIKTFEQVDVSTMVEKPINGTNQALQYIVRDVNHRTVEDINRELRALKKMSYEDLMPKLDRNFYRFAPSFVRKWFWWRIRRNPRLRKQFIGTTAVTNIGMFGTGVAFPRPPGVVATGVWAIGTTYEKQVETKDGPETRFYLCSTLCADHRLIDGGIATRFMTYLKVLALCDGSE